MNRISDIHLRRIYARLGDVAYEMTRVQFQSGPPARSLGWSPALNVYWCEHCLVICADLAGVERHEIQLRVEPRRLFIRGRRDAPEPKDDACKALQVLTMEIDHGAFEREVQLPVDVETERVNAEQKNGLLWIYLPVRPAA